MSDETNRSGNSCQPVRLVTYLTASVNLAPMNRLKEIREGRGMTQKQLASLLNTTDVSISRYEVEDQRLTLPLLRKLAEALDCMVSEIIGEKSKPGASSEFDEFALVPVYDARVSAGPGAINDPDPRPIHHHAFRLDWLHTLDGGFIDHLAVLRVVGDSMWQTLHNGDHVLVDVSVNRYSRDGLYVIRYDLEEETMVKRLSRDPRTRTLTVKSDNPEYPTHPGVRDEDIQVIGRVLWLGRNIG